MTPAGYYEAVEPLNERDYEIISRRLAKRVDRRYYAIGLDLGYDVECLFAYIRFLAHQIKIPQGKTRHWQYASVFYQTRRLLNVLIVTEFEGWMRGDSVGRAFDVYSNMLTDGESYDSFKYMLEQACYIEASDPSDAIDGKDALDQALQELSERDRRAVELLLEYDFDVAQLACEFGVSKRTAVNIRRQVFLALAGLLRAMFGELVEGDADYAFFSRADQKKRKYLKRSGRILLEHVYEIGNNGPFSRAMLAQNFKLTPVQVHSKQLPLTEFKNAGFLNEVNVTVDKRRPWEKFYVWNKKKTFQDFVDWRLRKSQ